VKKRPKAGKETKETIRTEEEEKNTEERKLNFNKFKILKGKKVDSALQPPCNVSLLFLAPTAIGALLLLSLSFFTETLTCKEMQISTVKMNQQIFRIFILLTASSCCSVVMCHDLSEVIPGILSLGDLRSRISRQFQHLDQFEDGAKSGGSISETNIAMSLVDALQKWADALEAQISMMREDVAELKTSNGQLTDKVSNLEMDNVRLTDEVGHLTTKLDELTGKMNTVHDSMNVVEGLKDDIVVMSSSFGEFLGHFNNYSIAVMSNYSLVTEELSTTVTSIRGLYSTMTAINIESKASMKNFSLGLSKISSQMFEMESGLGLYKNFTLHRIETIEKEVESMGDGMVNRTMVEKLVAHFSEEISDVRVSTTQNFSVISNEVKDMATAVHQTLYNASFLIFHDVEEVKTKAERVASEVKDLKKFGQTVQNDLKSVSASLEYVAGGSEDRWRKSEIKLINFGAKIEDLLLSLSNVDLRIREVESSIGPTVNELNVSLSASIGSLRSNVTHLDKMTEGLKSGLFKIESQVRMTEISQTANTNATVAIQTRVRKVEETVGDLQGKFIEFIANVEGLAEGQADLSKNATLLRSNLANLESGLFELGRLTKKGEANSSMLQLGYRGLERHYVELKRDLFETQLQVVSLNASLNSVGEIRQDLMSVGKAVANTTSFLTNRIEEVSTNCGELKEEIYQMWNKTHFTDDKLHRFMNSYNHSSGNMISTMTKFKDELGKTHNRTTYLEFGLAGIMNFSLEIDSTLRLVQDNITGCILAINELNLNGTHMSAKLEKLSKIQKHQNHLIMENSNHIEGNVSQLSLAANILETELSRLVSSYGGLKLALSNQIQSVGVMELNIQKMTKQTLTLKSEIDSMKFELTSVKSETTGVNVFLASMQNHITDLTSNVSAVTQNVSIAMSDIDDMKDHLMSVDANIDSLHVNVSQAIDNIGSNGVQFESVKSNMSTIKTNLVGLGNYINNINGDLSQLLVSFDGYAKKMATELSGIKGNLSDVSIDMTSAKTSSVELKNQLETVEFMATSVRNDVTGLTTKIYNIKTSLFEQTNDLTSVKTSQTHIQVC